jgi:hypothetical protein
MSCLQAVTAELSLDAQRAHMTTMLQSTPPSSRRRERTMSTAKPTVKPTVKAMVKQRAEAAAVSSCSSAIEENTDAVAAAATAAAADVDSKPQLLLCVVCTVHEAALWCPECKSTYCMM